MLVTLLIGSTYRAGSHVFIKDEPQSVPGNIALMLEDEEFNGEPLFRIEPEEKDIVGPRQSDGAEEADTSSEDEGDEGDEGDDESNTTVTTEEDKEPLSNLDGGDTKERKARGRVITIGKGSKDV